MLQDGVSFLRTTSRTRIPFSRHVQDGERRGEERRGEVRRGEEGEERRGEFVSLLNHQYMSWRGEERRGEERRGEVRRVFSLVR